MRQRQHEVLQECFDTNYKCMGNQILLEQIVSSVWYTGVGH